MDLLTASWSRLAVTGALLSVLGTVPLVAGTTASVGVEGGGMTRVSVSDSEAQAVGESRYQAISADGRRVAFTSGAANLVSGDTNGRIDVFVRDVATGRTTRASVSSSEAQGDRSSGDGAPSISADGRYVAYTSRATNLVAQDTNGTLDVFVRDLDAGTTRRVSVTNHGRQSNGPSQDPFLTASGGRVAFRSEAMNLVRHDTNRASDIFVRNLTTRTTRRVSVSSREHQGNCGSFNGGGMSRRGRFVVFSSCASNLVRDDTNRAFDVFVRDRATGTTRRVSVGGSEAQAKGFSGETTTISSDGRYVAFNSDAANLVRGDTNRDSDVFLRDRRRGTTERVSIGNGGVQARGFSHEPAVSSDGRYVAFSSSAPNLAAGTGQVYQIYLRDRLNHTTVAVSTNENGAPGNGFSETPVISPVGRYIAFSSLSSDLVPNDTNEQEDVFLRDLG